MAQHVLSLSAGNTKSRDPERVTYVHTHRQQHATRASMTEARAISVHGYAPVRLEILQPKPGRWVRKISKTGKRGRFSWAAVGD